MARVDLYGVGVVGARRLVGALHLRGRRVLLARLAWGEGLFLLLDDVGKSDVGHVRFHIAVIRVIGIES